MDHGGPSRQGREKKKLGEKKGAHCHMGNAESADVEYSRLVSPRGAAAPSVCDGDAFLRRGRLVQQICRCIGDPTCNHVTDETERAVADGTLPRDDLAFLILRAATEGDFFWLHRLGRAHGLNVLSQSADVRMWTQAARLSDEHGHPLLASYVRTVLATNGDILRADPHRDLGVAGPPVPAAEQVWRDVDASIDRARHDELHAALGLLAAQAEGIPVWRTSTVDAGARERLAHSLLRAVHLRNEEAVRLLVAHGAVPGPEAAAQAKVPHHRRPSPRGSTAPAGRDHLLGLYLDALRGADGDAAAVISPLVPLSRLVFFNRRRRLSSAADRNPVAPPPQRRRLNEGPVDSFDARTTPR